ncbi:hypothetical protein [Streptomyces sp. NPDC048496]|uniref:hypothetical protein n=1 Tax=Streptomyces sp. NPDC048496 TaxID=3365558 RepID=UPI00371995E4
MDIPTSGWKRIDPRAVRSRSGDGNSGGNDATERPTITSVIDRPGGSRSLHLTSCLTLQVHMLRAGICAPERQHLDKHLPHPLDVLARYVEFGFDPDSGLILR